MTLYKEVVKKYFDTFNDIVEVSFNYSESGELNIIEIKSQSNKYSYYPIKLSLHN